MSDDLSCGTGVNCQEHEEKTWLKHKNVNLFSNDLTIIDRVYYMTIFSIFSKYIKTIVDSKQSEKDIGKYIIIAKLYRKVVSI